MLFDLGRGGPTAELLVRTADRTAIAALRAAAGAPADDTIADLLDGPGVHRVVRSAAGRIEVYGTPRRRAVPAPPPSAPIPDGWVPCLMLRPPHPATDRTGHPKPFDHDRHLAFQALLVEHGDPLLGVLEANVITAVRSGRGLGDALVTDEPASRATVAVTVRQLAMTDGTSGALTAWRSRYGTG